MRQNTTIINCSKSLFKESIVFIKSIQLLEIKDIDI